ncbi:MAG: ubiquinol-cytochrome C chaperone family protein [Hellea sp.]
MGIFSKLFGGKDPVMTDAGRIYTKLMGQARQAAFYGEGRAPDNYDGRIDVLTLHIAAVLEALSHHGEQGERLSQAVYDVMRDDFEVAMREEGLSDTGIKRRIKPMMQLFYTRVKSYVEALKSEGAENQLRETFEAGLLAESGAAFASRLSGYAAEFSQNLKGLTLGQIALAEFDIPAAPN